MDEAHKYRRFGFILFWSGIMLGALLGIVGDAMQSLSWRLGHFIENLAGIGGLVLLAGLGMMIFSRFFASVTRSEPGRPRAIQPPAGIVGHPDQHPDISFENSRPVRAPSVTEHTTYTLDQRGPGSKRG